MFFWGLVVGIVAGYIFKPQIDRLVQMIRDAINSRKDGDGDGDDKS